jgi:hypothetical protein
VRGPGGLAAADDVVVPAQDRVRGDQQPQPVAAGFGYHAEQGREQGPVRPVQLRAYWLEHKQTLRYDMRAKQANPKLEDAVMDRICGFWNADGGTLLVGVEDRTGRVTGLGPDLKLVRDLYALLNRLSQRLRNDLPSLAPFVRITPDPVGSEMVLRIGVPAGDRPLFWKDRLMARVNNTTQELKGESQLDYIRSRFGPT